MFATYDSSTERLHVHGQRPSSPRIWTIQVRADGMGGVLTIKTKQPVFLRELSQLVV